MEERFREVRRLLDTRDEELGEGFEARPITSRDVYAEWAPSYDGQANQLLEIEEPIVRELLDALPVGVALDAACGTGRHAAYLASLGHTVIGVDESPEMLAVARAKLPAGELRQGRLDELPLADDSVDLVVCSLALVHVPDLAAVFAEVARVLRPGGHLVTSDQRGLIDTIAIPITRALDDGGEGYMPLYVRRTSEFLETALAHGFELRRIEEPVVPSPLITDDGVTLHDGERLPDHVPGEPFSIWSLHAKATAATNAAWRNKPSSLILLLRQSPAR
jgi:ubiquinone/menaquinone biosynthesis C-methylase UbiE